MQEENLLEETIALTLVPPTLNKGLDNVVEVLYLSWGLRNWVKN